MAEDQYGLITRRFVEAVRDGRMTREEVEKACEVLNVDFHMPFVLEAEGYVWSNGAGIVVCKNPSGTNNSQTEAEKYVNSDLLEQLQRQKKHLWGGTRVKVTVEELV